MSADFESYLQPCPNSIDARLKRSVYSPHLKSFGVLGDVIAADRSSDVLHKDSDDVTITSSPSSSVIGACHHQEQRDLRSMTSSELQPMSYDTTSSSWTCEHDPEDSAVSSAHVPSQSVTACRTPRAGNRSSESISVESSQLQGAGVYRKLSLPARLRSLADLTPEIDLQSSPGGSSLRRSQTQTSLRRRHTSSGVKFADEIGENLTTFAIIPSRFDINLSSSPVSKYDDDHRSTDNIITDPSRQITMNSTRLERTLIAASALPPTLRSRDRNTADDRFSDPSPLTVTHDKFHQPGLFNDARITFSMFFEQPIANHDTFQRRLNDQSVCLENVKVINSSPVYGTSSSWMMDVLCTAKAKHSLPLDWRSQRRLFARWTDDGWVSYADITAQCITCDALTRSTWLSTNCVDTYSFAVQLRQPRFSLTVHERETSVASGYSALSSGCSACRHDNRLHSSAAVMAVEFALCYVFNEATFWDNNDRRNYRIEWYQR